jgi:hypothetical protein
LDLFFSFLFHGGRHGLFGENCTCIPSNFGDSISPYR